MAAKGLDARDARDPEPAVPVTAAEPTARAAGESTVSATLMTSVAVTTAEAPSGRPAEPGYR
ncbi:hypothetical protein H7H80_30440 [Mycobacterium interjectum]|nr:hypothetical protein [Mycobacterium interjectum]